MATLKEKAISRILVKLEVDGKEDFTELTENLKKMGKSALDILYEYIEEMIIEKRPKKVKKRRIETKEPFLPDEVLPTNFFGATKPAEIAEQLHVLPLVSGRLGDAFVDGEFPAIKRNIGIINVITGNCQRLIAKQLWENVDIHQDIDETLEEEDLEEDESGYARDEDLKVDE